MVMAMKTLKERSEYATDTEAVQTGSMQANTDDDDEDVDDEATLMMILT